MILWGWVTGMGGNDAMYLLCGPEFEKWMNNELLDDK